MDRKEAAAARRAKVLARGGDRLAQITGSIAGTHSNDVQTLRMPKEYSFVCLPLSLAFTTRV